MDARCRARPLMGAFHGGLQTAFETCRSRWIKTQRILQKEALRTKATPQNLYSFTVLRALCVCLFKRFYQSPGTQSHTARKRCEVPSLGTEWKGPKDDSLHLIAGELGC